MKTAQKIQVNYYTKAAYEVANSLSCPRSVNDVYNLGITLQYCVRAKYLELAELLNDKAWLKDQAAQQLAVKSKIEKLAAYNLDIQLIRFYEQGGPIMDDPVSSTAAQQIQPFFSRIMSRFLEMLDALTSQVLTKKISVEELPAAVSQQMIETYAAMERMFQDQDLQSAFAELIEIKQP